MAQVVLDYKIISYSKIHVWLFKLRPKTDFHDRNSESIRRKFSTKVQTLLNNLLLFNFFPSPGISGMEGTRNCHNCRSSSGEDTVAWGCCSFPGVWEMLVPWPCLWQEALLALCCCGEQEKPVTPSAKSQSVWLFFNPWHTSGLFSERWSSCSLLWPHLPPRTCIFTITSLCFAAPSALVPMGPGLSSKGCSPPISGVKLQLRCCPAKSSAQLLLQKRAGFPWDCVTTAALFMSQTPWSISGFTKLPQVGSWLLCWYRNRDIPLRRNKRNDCKDNYQRTVEWFGLVGTFKLILFHPLS